MTLRLAILILLCLIKGAASDQLAPPQPEWSWRSALVWQVPEPVAKSISFALTSNDRVQSSTNLIDWQDTQIVATNTFTVPNDKPQEFFRVVPKIVLPMYEATGNYNHVQQPKEWHGWPTNYNRCVGYWVAIIRAPATYRLFTNSPAAITLQPDEYQAEITWGWRWQDNNGREI